MVIKSVKRSAKTNQKSSSPVEKATVAVPKPADDKETPKSFCFCKVPPNEWDFYIGCDQCECWFHGKCVKINQDFAKFIDNYFCFRCLNNKSPSQGKFILKSHLVNNNEVYINPLNSEDPNMYYGYNPNKTAITLRQKHLQESKWKERGEKKKVLEKELKEIIKKQKSITNKISKLEKKLSKTNEKVPKRSKRLLRSQAKKDNQEAKKEKTNEEEPKKIKENIADLNANLSKLKRKESEFRMTICNMEHISTKNNLESINKTVESSIRDFVETEGEMKTKENDTNSEFSPQNAWISQSIVQKKVPRKKKEQNTPLKPPKRKNSQRDNGAAKFKTPQIGSPVPLQKLNAPGRLFSPIIRAEPAPFQIQMPRRSMAPPPGLLPLGVPPRFPTPQTLPRRPLNVPNLNNLDIFRIRSIPNAPSGPPPVKPPTEKMVRTPNFPANPPSTLNNNNETFASKQEENNNKSVEERIKERIAKTRKEALEKLMEIPNITSETASEIEEAVFKTTNSLCNFWYDETFWYHYSPTDNQNASIEKNEGFEFKNPKNVKENKYTTFINRCLIRLSKFVNLRNSVLQKEVSPKEFALMNSKKVNEIENKAKFRTKTLNIFSELLGEKNGKDLENELFEKLWKSGSKEYLQKGRELVLNLQQNKSLIEKMKKGEITPKGLAHMKEEELESKKQAEWRKSVDEENKREKIREKKITGSVMVQQKELEKRMADGAEEDRKNEGERKGKKVEAKGKQSEQIVNNALENNEEITGNEEERILWNGTLGPYSKHKFVDLNAVNVVVYQLGGPLLQFFPFPSRQHLKMVGRTDTCRVFQNIKEKKEKKIMAMFEIRPENENLMHDYSRFCSYFMAVKRCPVYTTPKKEFTLYVIPPDSEDTPSEEIQTLVNNVPPEGCLWAIGYFQNNEVVNKFKKTKDPKNSKKINRSGQTPPKMEGKGKLIKTHQKGIHTENLENKKRREIKVREEHSHQRENTNKMVEGKEKPIQTPKKRRTIILKEESSPLKLKRTPRRLPPSQEEEFKPPPENRGFGNNTQRSDFRNEFRGDLKKDFASGYEKRNIDRRDVFEIHEGRLKNREELQRRGYYRRVENQEETGRAEQNFSSPRKNQKSNYNGGGNSHWQRQSNYGRTQSEGERQGNNYQHNYNNKENFPSTPKGKNRNMQRFRSPHSKQWSQRSPSPRRPQGNFGQTQGAMGGRGGRNFNSPFPQERGSWRHNQGERHFQRTPKGEEHFEEGRNFRHAREPPNSQGERSNFAGNRSRDRGWRRGRARKQFGQNAQGGDYFEEGQVGGEGEGRNENRMKGKTLDFDSLMNEH